MKSILITFVFFCIFCNHSLAQQNVTISLNDGDKTPNLRLVDIENNRVGEITIVFSKITKEDEEYRFDLQFQLRGLGNENRLFITDRNLDRDQLRTTLQDIRPDLQLSRSFLQNMTRGRISVEPFFNNVSPGNSISLKNKFEKSGGHTFNIE